REGRSGRKPAGSPPRLRHRPPMTDWSPPMLHPSLRRAAPPRLTGEVHVAATADQLYDDLAMLLLGVASDAVAQRDAFHLALSGGSTPEPFYMRLVIDPRFRGLPWDRTHLWIVDERRVPETDECSNY